MVESIIAAVDQLANDRIVPRNVKRVCSECLDILRSDEEFSIKINSCISILDDISNDPNIPSYVRTQIWNILSMLEVAGAKG